MSLISIVVPVYRTEKYIRICIDSVLNQTFSDFELILVDDSSPDNCGAICDEYAAEDSRIHVIHQKNGGAGKARNVGMDYASGKYLIFLDSDDYWNPETLEKLYIEAERYNTQALVFGASIFANGIDGNNVIKQCRYNKLDGFVGSGTDGLTMALDYKEYRSEVWSRFYLLDYLREKSLRFDEGIIREDVRFAFLSILWANRVKYINEYLYNYRKHPDSIMSSSLLSKSMQGCCVALNGLLGVYFSDSCSGQENILLKKYCIIRAEFIWELYEQSFRSVCESPKTVGYIRKEAQCTLNRMRNIPGLPYKIKVSTYCLFVRHIYMALKKFMRLRTKLKKNI